MKPKADPASQGRQSSLFADGSPALLDFINRKHPLVRMADAMQWELFETYWSGLHSDAGGHMASSGRLVAGLLMLKHMEALSDERLMDVWVTNPYFQYFCGETHFQHRPPVDPTSMTKWRNRLGEEGLEWLLTTVVESAVKSDVVERSSFAHLSADSTVMEKHIAHPTDSALLETMRGKLVAFMREHGLSLRQSYSRQGPRIAQQIGRHAHAKQYKRMRRMLRKQRTWVGRLQRELERQLGSLPSEVQPKAEGLIALAVRLLEQTKNPKAKNKLYSLHEPAVDCISKGKARKRYEFGTKVGVVCTQRENFVVGMRSYPGNPYDGHTLDDLLQQAETITSTEAATVVVDLGYRGSHDTQAKVIHRGRKLSKREKKRLRRRSALEAIIGHMKVDGLLGRCHLKGSHGDAVHAILCGIGHNLRQMRAYWVLRLFASWIVELRATKTAWATSYATVAL
ncbi:MAG: IS5 family transposase [Pseudomonadota bacterium]